MIQEITETRKVVSPIKGTREQNYSETINAVASITGDGLDNNYQTAVNTVSEIAVDLIQALITQEETEDLENQEIDRYVNEHMQNEIELLKRKESDMSSRRIGEKGKCNDTEDSAVSSKRQLFESKGQACAFSDCETDEDLMYIANSQGSRVILNIGEARFETCTQTLKKDPQSLLAKLFTPDSPVVQQGNSVLIDRDASHFKVIPNYLRYDLDLNPALLPRDRKQLLELEKECEYFRVKGLAKMVKRRLELLTELYGDY